MEAQKTLIAQAIVDSAQQQVLKDATPEHSSASSSITMNDGLENIVSGMGGENDKSVYNKWTHSGKNLDWVQLAARYREDWVSQKVCNIIPQDMTRTWRHIESQEGRDADDELCIADKFREAYKWARVYGTCFIVLDIKGSGPLSKPLNLKRLKKGCIKSLQVIDRTRMHAMGTMDTEPMSPTYGLPTHYQFVNSASSIHHSRLLRFEATELPLYEFMRNQWYSDSTLIPLMEVIDNFHTSAKAAAQLCQEAVVDVVSIEGLQDILTSEEGEAQIMKRFRVMKQLKSLYNVLLLDSTEEYSTKTAQLNGVKDLIWEYLRIIAAAVGIPATRFLSASPDGMNATGESDLNNYIDLLMGLQKAIFKPKLKIIDKLIEAHYGIDKIRYEFNPIFPESPLQKAERIKKTIEPIQMLVDSDIITAEDAQMLINKEQLFGHDVPFQKPPEPRHLLKEKGNTDAKKPSS
ncbi:MAG: DUF1073 domain-containing protein [Ekhidna sp.]|nr:DUF1073 domain-containing protein [Ekhidna sp.]